MYNCNKSVYARRKCILMYISCIIMSSVCHRRRVLMRRIIKHGRS